MLVGRRGSLAHGARRHSPQNITLGTRCTSQSEVSSAAECLAAGGRTQKESRLREPLQMSERIQWLARFEEAYLSKNEVLLECEGSAVEEGQGEARGREAVE